MPDESATRIRVGIVHPYWTLWEHTAPQGFRAQRMALAREVATLLGAAFRCGDPVEIASVEDAAREGRRMADWDPDVVLVLQTMAAPPAWALALLDAVPAASVVVWALHETGLVGSDFDHAAITTMGATVGAPMVTNVLARGRRPFELVLGRLSVDATMARVTEALGVAGTATRLRRARIGRIGRPLPGYLHVDVPNEDLASGTGMTVVAVDPDEVVQRYREVEAARVVELDADVRANWLLEEDCDEGESLGRSLRAALALEAVVETHRLDAAAFNCHVPQFRFGDEIGIAPCWGLGRLTTMGIPFTCTGDILTAVAMLTTKRLGGAALYHELEAIDYATGELVIANSGEHDLAWLAPGERPRLRRNGWFCGIDPRCGVCAVIEPVAGPATLVGFTPHPEARGGFRYVVARGTLTTRRFPVTGTANGAFRFAAGTVEEAWVRWASAGVNHHSSATPGDLSGAVVGVARHMGIEAVVV